jgi:hypothetical protein
MNVFVLTTGRSGSLTFAWACSHITNYTTGHESRRSVVGPARLAYPDRHIEVDNRLAWFLGRLGEANGDEARYVHLLRDPEAVAQSYARRWQAPLIRTYRRGILFEIDDDADRLAVARDLVSTLTANIEAFLATRRHVMRIRIEEAAAVFPDFWKWIRAEGDLAAALAELGKRYHEGGGAGPSGPILKPQDVATRSRRG